MPADIEPPPVKIRRAYVMLIQEGIDDDDVTSSQHLLYTASKTYAGIQRQTRALIGRHATDRGGASPHGRGAGMGRLYRQQTWPVTA